MVALRPQSLSMWCCVGKLARTTPLSRQWRPPLPLCPAHAVAYPRTPIQHHN